MLTINRVITLPTVSSGYSELYCRSGARSVASRKSGGAERSGEQELQKNDRAEREVAEREAGVTEIGRSTEQVFLRSRSTHMIWTHVIQYRVFGVVFLIYVT